VIVRSVREREARQRSLAVGRARTFQVMSARLVKGAWPWVERELFKL
jgi:hypothetical protein